MKLEELFMRDLEEQKVSGVRDIEQRMAFSVGIAKFGLFASDESRAEVPKLRKRGQADLTQINTLYEQERAIKTSWLNNHTAVLSELKQKVPELPEHESMVPPL
jgi:phage terminase small subunit